MSQATMAKYFGSAVISTPLGKYSRTIRLRFSLLPRSHGECGCAKYTGSPVAVIADRGDLAGEHVAAQLAGGGDGRQVALVGSGAVVAGGLVVVDQLAAVG